MATARKIHLTPESAEWQEYRRSGITEQQSRKATTLLQENHDHHHIFFKPEDRLHNHIVHHMLAIWALNATPEQLQKNYDKNKPSQHAQPDLDSEMLEKLHDPATFISYLGVANHYYTFLRFFQNEIEKSSSEEVLQKYVFSGDERAEEMFARQFAGFLHPLIHEGYAIESRQPALVAEALAQTACHDGWIGKLLFPAENAAKERRTLQPQSKSIVQLIDEVYADETLQAAAHWEDGNKIRDGVIARASERMTEIASQFHVNPEDLDEKTAEMTNAVCYYTAGAQHPPNMIMWDFYFMHCVNSTIFFPAFNALPWLPQATKIRLLEWKVRLDLAMYASRHCPPIRINEIRSYQAQHASHGWDDIMDRVCEFTDDGHSAKLIRALAHGQRICAPYEGKEGFRVKHDDWLRMGHMAIDSVENSERLGTRTWVRSAGFERAWEGVPLRAQL